MATDAVTFNGSSQYGILPNFAALGDLTDYTIELWIKRSSSSPAYATILSLNDETTETTWWGSESGSNSQGSNWDQPYDGANDADGYINSSSGFLVAATWTHIAFVHRSTEKKVFIFKNGVEWNGYDLQQTGAGSIVTSPDVNFYLNAYYTGGIGTDMPADVGGFVRIWNRALPGSEIYYNYNKKLDPANESGLIVNLNFSEGSGSTLDNDASPGNDLTLYGSPSWTTGPTTSSKSYTNTYQFNQVTASANDSEENSSGTSQDLTSSDLEFSYDGANPGYIGMRFTGVNIPSGATIQSAVLRFVGDEAQSTGTVNVTIKGHDVDNSGIFTSSAGDISGRYSGAPTTASVTWSTVPASVVGQIQASPDVTTIVQEIIDRGGWSSGNAMTFLVRGAQTTLRTYESYDGQPYSAPMLEVQYTTSTGTNMQINIGDTWKSVAGMQINIGDTWKTVTAVKQNIGDTWKDVF